MNVTATKLTRKAMNHFTSHKDVIIEIKGEEYYRDVETTFNALLDKLDVLDRPLPAPDVVTLKPTDQVIRVNAITNENGF